MPVQKCLTNCCGVVDIAYFSNILYIYVHIIHFVYLLSFGENYVSFYVFLKLMQIYTCGLSMYGLFTETGKHMVPFAVIEDTVTWLRMFVAMIYTFTPIPIHTLILNSLAIEEKTCCNTPYFEGYLLIYLILLLLNVYYTYIVVECIKYYNRPRTVFQQETPRRVLEPISEDSETEENVEPPKYEQIDQNTYPSPPKYEDLEPS